MTPTCNPLNEAKTKAKLTRHAPGEYSWGSWEIERVPGWPARQVGRAPWKVIFQLGTHSRLSFYEGTLDDVRKTLATFVTTGVLQPQVGRSS